MPDCLSGSVYSRRVPFLPSVKDAWSNICSTAYKSVCVPAALCCFCVLSDTWHWGFSRALHWIRWRLDFLHRPVPCPQPNKVELNQPPDGENLNRSPCARQAVEVGGGNSTLLIYNHGGVVAIVDAALMLFTWEISTVRCRTQLNFTSTDDFSTSSSGGHEKSRKTPIW